MEQEEENAATKIQSMERGRNSRRRSNEVMEEKREAKAYENELRRIEAEREDGAAKIQRGFKGRKARDEVDGRRQAKAEEEDREAKAVMIQSNVRRHQTQKAYHELQEEMDEREQDAAATMIQSNYRGANQRKKSQTTD